MDDLQDAIEDAQFINAMHDDTPKPTLQWVFPSLEEVDAYVNKLRLKNEELLEMAGICTNCLGFYLVLRHISTSGDKVMSNFIYDVARFRHSPPLTRPTIAKQIIKDYLLPTSCGRTVRRDNPSNITRILPPNTDYLADCWSSYLDINNSDLNILGLHGPFLDEVISGSTEYTSAVADSSTSAAAAAVPSATHNPPPPHCPSAATASASCDAPLNLFDKLDLIIFCYLKETHWESFKNSGNYIKYFNFLTLSEKPVSENDFSLFRVLGRGGFGVVNGCKKCQTGQLYAMKVLDRKRIKMKKSETLCMTERNILIMIDSPFVVCMKYAYATASELFLILDLMVGGDLGYHLYRKGMFNHRETKYYVCRTLLGLKALHDLNIVFRDLKPDNILMDGHGRTKLSDLGLAVRVPRNGLTGACGTRGYWAPEMLRRDPSGYRIRYNLSVDWFSFGCLLYEFMTGVCPFRTEVARNWGGFGKKEKEKAIDLAVQEMDPFFDNEIFDPTTQDLISKLLMKDGRARLGANGSGEVMAHAYFDDINWEEYIHDLVPAPCLPRKDLNVASQSEIGYFGDDANAKKLELNEGDMELFAKWDYIRPAAFLEEVVQFMQYEELRGPIKVLSHTSACCSIS